MDLLPVLNESVPRSSSGPFRFERDMFASVSELLPRRIARVPDRWIQLREPAIGNVIPDLLFGEWRDELRPLKRNFTFVEARILAILEQHDELREAEISRMLHLSEPAAARAFKRIERSELVVRTRDGRISLDAGGFTRGLIVTAIELKLSRWREALEQATGYLKFADRAYVVLDADRSGGDEEMTEAFRASRVGLFMLGGGDLTPVVTAEERHCVSVQRVQAVQKLCVSLTASGRLQASVGTPALEGV
jgi:DNA-binding Lrp family transcriptional regulator